MESTNTPRRLTGEIEQAVPVELWHSYSSHVIAGSDLSVIMARREIVAHLVNIVDAIPGFSTPCLLEMTAHALGQAWNDLDYSIRGGLTALTPMARRSVVRHIVHHLDILAGSR